MITTLSGVKTLGKATVIVDIVDKGNPEIRPAYFMNPSEIAIHNTGNSGRGANAKAHNVYIHNQAKLPVAKTGYASWHFSVDDKFIYQHIPLNETAWHTGDGSGAKSGNLNAIGIEICENVDMENYAQAEENAIALAVYLMKQRGIKIVKPHQKYSGKYCPRVILKRDGSFDKFHKRIMDAYNYKPVVAQSVTPNKPKSHTVLAGDTFSKIADKYGMKLADVLAYNPRVKPEALQIGDVVHLVPVPTSVPKPVSKPKPAPKPVSKPKPVMKSVTKKGSTGQAVKDVQYLLAKKGYNIKVDGKFGTDTETMVKDFQKKNKLVADGIVGQSTWNKLV